MATEWSDFRKTLKLSREDEEIIRLEAALIEAVVDAREQSGLTQRQLSELCGIKQPVLARLESAAHSPQINSLIKILRPLGYTLAVVKSEMLTPKTPALQPTDDCYAEGFEAELVPAPGEAASLVAESARAYRSHATPRSATDAESSGE